MLCDTTNHKLRFPSAFLTVECIIAQWVTVVFIGDWQCVEYARGDLSASKTTREQSYNITAARQLQVTM